MAQKPTPPKTPKAKTAGAKLPAELHQQSQNRDALTTNQGVVISDNQNSLRQGSRGPTLLEDFILREKITHFDHERIPERIVHARGSGAHGYFQPYESLSGITKAAFLQDPGTRTEVFVRFSTVAGGAGSGDMPRDVRGFAVKFYTSEGNFDLVGNNIPVFFIQDAIKFPDLVHSVKMEPDRGYPQAATAHATFWDFVSLTPESMHMLLWIMSDRTVPRSFRTMEGFGVHTFRLVNADGESRFVKFHWRPKIGSASVLWDEAVKINGADPDFLRRDLYTAIEKGHYPEFELGLQVFDQATADSFDFDVLDATKIIPEETVPLKMAGKLVLDRNPDNFFAETEQVAFCPSHIVPGIEFSDDPLLQGRLFSYLDTQLSRLGGPNFHQIPVNASRCPMHNFQRDGLRTMVAPKGRVSYEPNSLDDGHTRENPARGFSTFPEEISGEKLRKRSETFADHYTQARLFFRSMTGVEQQHIVNAFSFELGMVEVKAIRTRMLGHLKLVDEVLYDQVADCLGMQGEADKIQPAVAPHDMEPSPALSLLTKARKTIAGRKIGVLVADGFDAGLLKALQSAAKAEEAEIAVIAPKAGGATDQQGGKMEAEFALNAAPSVLFDALIVLAGEGSGGKLAQLPAAVNWMRDAYGHQKVIGHTQGAAALLKAASVKTDAGVILLPEAKAVDQFVAAAKNGRVWDRQPSL